MISDWGCFWIGAGLACMGVGFMLGCEEIGENILRTWGKK